MPRDGLVLPFPPFPSFAFFGVSGLKADSFRSPAGIGF